MTFPRNTAPINRGQPPSTHPSHTPRPYATSPQPYPRNPTQETYLYTVPAWSTNLFWLQIILVAAMPVTIFWLRITFDAFWVNSFFLLLPYTCMFYVAIFTATANRPPRIGRKVILPATATAYFIHSVSLILLSLSLPDQIFPVGIAYPPLATVGPRIGSQPIITIASIIGIIISGVACLAFAIMEKPSAKYRVTTPNLPPH